MLYFKDVKISFGLGCVNSENYNDKIDKILEFINENIEEVEDLEVDYTDIVEV